MTSFLGPDGRAADLDGAALAKVGRVVIAAAVVLNNIIDAVAVLVLTLLVIPLPEVEDGLESRDYVVAAVVYVVVAAIVGVIVGVRGQRPLRRWLASGSSGPALRREVLRPPLRLFWLRLGCGSAPGSRSACSRRATTRSVRCG